jgi:hypothetical protein
MLLTLSAQTLTFGVKGGARVTDDLDSYWANSESKGYVIGSMFLVGLRRGFAIEIDALYRRVGYRNDSVDIIGDVYATRARGNSLEFPVLLRKTIAGGFYGAAGYVPRIITGSAHTDLLSVIDINNPSVQRYQEFNSPNPWNTTHGIPAAIGIERRLGPLRIAPEARYTFWTSSSLREEGSHGFSIYSNQHQLDILVGITWGGR